MKKLILVLGRYTLPRYVITSEVQNIFKDGNLVDETYAKRLNALIDEFLWLT